MQKIYIYAGFRWITLFGAFMGFRYGFLGGTRFDLTNESATKFFFGFSILVVTMHVAFFFPNEEELRRLNAYSNSDRQLIACLPLIFAALLFCVIGNCGK